MSPAALRDRARKLEADDEAERQEFAAAALRIREAKARAASMQLARAVASLKVTVREHLRRQATGGDISLPGDGA